MDKYKKISHKDLAGILSVVGDKNRLEILCLIFEHDGFCVSDIAKKLNLSVAVVSHHLKVMADKGIMAPVREGKKACYVLKKSRIMHDLKKLICKYK